MKWLIGLMVLLAVGGYFYFGKTSYSPPATPNQSSENLATPPAAPSGRQETPAASAAREIKVSMVKLRFDPSTVTVKAGEKIKLNLSSDVSHTYTIDKLGINFALEGGETKSFDLAVAEKGTYDVYCAIPGHKEVGMVGKLVVE